MYQNQVYKLSVHIQEICLGILEYNSKQKYKIKIFTIRNMSKYYKACVQYICF